MEIQNDLSDQDRIIEPQQHHSEIQTQRKRIKVINNQKKIYQRKNVSSDRILSSQKTVFRYLNKQKSLEIKRMKNRAKFIDRCQKDAQINLQKYQLPARIQNNQITVIEPSNNQQSSRNNKKFVIKSQKKHQRKGSKTLYSQIEDSLNAQTNSRQKKYKIELVKKKRNNYLQHKQQQQNFNKVRQSQKQSFQRLNKAKRLKVLKTYRKGRQNIQNFWNQQKYHHQNLRKHKKDCQQLAEIQTHCLKNKILKAQQSYLQKYQNTIIQQVVLSEKMQSFNQKSARNIGKIL